MTCRNERREFVIEMINSVLVRIRAPEELSREILHAELEELKNTVEALKRELSAVRPGDIGQEYIPGAADELEAVVGATESATESIMNACDSVLTLAKETDKSSEIEDLVVNIYEACSFQDITGQRIRKVTSSLKQIDAKVKSIMEIMDGQIFDPQFMSSEIIPLEKSFLSGPALPQTAVSQDEIDMLLSRLDEERSVM